MNKIPPLTEGALERISQGDEPESPVFQILGAKKIAGGAGPRTRLLISDGKHCNSYAFLGTQLNSMHDDGLLADFTIVRCDNYIVSVVRHSSDQGRRVLVILGMTVLATGEEVGVRIGDPKNLSVLCYVRHNKSINVPY